MSTQTSKITTTASSGGSWIRKGTASNCGSRRVSNSCANSQQGFSLFYVERFVISTEVKRSGEISVPLLANDVMAPGIMNF